MMLKKDLSRSQNVLYMSTLVIADVLHYQNILLIKYLIEKKIDICVQ